MNEPKSVAAPEWPILKTALRFENKIMRLVEDTVLLPSQEQMQYAYAERGPAVIIVPITHDGEMVLVRQYRHPVRERCLEVPAGTARDAGDLSLEEVAAKELREEVGGTAETMEHIGAFYSNNAMSDEACHVFLATGVSLSQEPNREPSESLKTLLVPAIEGVALAASGKMKTGPAALAVLMCADRLRARFASAP
jgi:ADP-ribose pyrophosphatase